MAVVVREIPPYGKKRLVMTSFNDWTIWFGIVKPKNVFAWLKYWYITVLNQSEN
jgi:hypothetical protein